MLFWAELNKIWFQGYLFFSSSLNPLINCLINMLDIYPSYIHKHII